MSDDAPRGTIHGVSHQETGLGASKCTNTRLLQQWAPSGWKALTPTAFLRVTAWPTYVVAQDNTAVLEDPVSMIMGVATDDCDFWDNLVP